MGVGGGAYVRFDTLDQLEFSEVKHKNWKTNKKGRRRWREKKGGGGG